MAWVVMLLLVTGALAAAAWWKVRGAMVQLLGAALALGAAGYALQGRPGLEGAPRAADGEASPVPLAAARRAFFGEFTASERWLTISESYARRGKTADAVGVLRSAIREHPRDAALWVGLGNALVDHAQVLTPAAELAYRRAAQVAPEHPAPPFFMGLALARGGEGELALALWRKLLAQAPADASWRPLVEDAAAALETASSTER